MSQPIDRSIDQPIHGWRNKVLKEESGGKSASKPKGVAPLHPTPRSRVSLQRSRLNSNRCQAAGSKLREGEQASVLTDRSRAQRAHVCSDR